MKAPLSLAGHILSATPLRSWRLRLRLFGGLIALCLVLSFFPQRYRAAMTLTPTDPTSLGLSGTLGQLGAAANVFGSQAALEVTLKVARSQYVRQLVARDLDLPHRLDKSPLQTDRWLEREVDIRTLRGGIVQMEMINGDPELARSIVGAFGEATRSQLGIISREQTDYKRQVLLKLVHDASDRLARAQFAYDTFRLKSRYSSPSMAINALGDRIPQLESEIRSKKVDLNAAREFGTDQNMRVRQILAEIDALNEQLQQVRSVAPDEQSSVGRVVRDSTEVDKLKRELDLSQSLYDNYKRFLQGTSVEDLTSYANVRVLEPAFIDNDRQINPVALAAAGLLLALALALEFYGMRPPVGGATGKSGGARQA